MNGRPLAGLKVVELSTFVAAPSCGRLFSDWGADVIKIESPKGDAWREMGKTHYVTSTEAENPIFDYVNSGKRSIVLDIKSKLGQEVLFRLLEDADVFITNTRKKSMVKLGLDYDSIKERFPKLIYATVTGYGDTGPEANNPGFDVVAFWGNSGIMVDLAVETENSYPLLAPTGTGDVICGTTLFGGICASLLARERSGRGDYVTISLISGAFWVSGFMHIRGQERYGDPLPKSRNIMPPLTAPYRCADGEWLMLGILEYERCFQAFCNALGIPEIAQDPRFNNQQTCMKPENNAAFIKILEDVFIQHDSAYWKQKLDEADLVNSRLRHYREIATYEQAWANNYVSRTTYPDGGSCVIPRSPIYAESLGVPPATEPGPLKGENTKEILSQLGYTEEEIDELLNSGTAQQHP